MCAMRCRHFRAPFSLRQGLQAVGKPSPLQEEHNASPCGSLVARLCRLILAMAQSAVRTLVPQMAKHLPDPGTEQPDASEARWLVWQMCQRYHHHALEPNDTELKEWWGICCVLKPISVVQAIEHQLQMSWNGQHDWRPPYRALHLLEYLHRQAATANAAREAVQKIRPLLIFLRAELPQFCGVTTRLLFFQPLLCGHRHRHDQRLPKLAVDEPISPEGHQGSSPSSLSNEISEFESDSQPETEQPLPTIPQSKIPVCIARAPGLAAWKVGWDNVAPL
eukprot:symbB.v1.2.022418.t1/scaffold1989.1/size93477/6